MDSTPGLKGAREALSGDLFLLLEELCDPAEVTQVARLRILNCGQLSY